MMASSSSTIATPKHPESTATTESTTNMSVEFPCSDDSNNGNYDDEDDVSFEYEYEHSDDDDNGEFEGKSTGLWKSDTITSSGTSAAAATGMVISATRNYDVSSSKPFAATAAASATVSTVPTTTACCGTTSNICQECGQETHAPIECDTLLQWLQLDTSGILVVDALLVVLPAMRRRIREIAERLSLEYSAATVLLREHNWNAQEAVRAKTRETTAGKNVVGWNDNGSFTWNERATQNTAAPTVPNSSSDDNRRDLLPGSSFLPGMVRDITDGMRLSDLIYQRRLLLRQATASTSAEAEMAPLPVAAAPLPRVVAYYEGESVLQSIKDKEETQLPVAGATNESDGTPPVATAHDSFLPWRLRNGHSSDVAAQASGARKGGYRRGVYRSQLRNMFHRLAERKDPPPSSGQLPASASFQETFAFAENSNANAAPTPASEQPKNPSKRPAEPTLPQKRLNMTKDTPDVLPGVGATETIKSVAAEASAPDVSSDEQQQSAESDSGECEICMEEGFSPEEMMGMSSCGHSFCRSCWRQFIQHMLPPTLKHGDGGNGGGTNVTAALTTSCPSFDCNQVVTQAEIEGVAPELLPVYEWCLLHSFVQHGGGSNGNNEDDTPFLRWCPGPDCDCVAVRSRQGFLLVGENDVPPVASCGKCLTKYCFRCGEAPHAPNEICPATAEQEDAAAAETAASALLASPAKRKKDDKKAIKLCPSCSVKIEKNGGCNHMRCKCGHHFCWICMEECTYSHFCGRERPTALQLPRLPANDATIPAFNLDYVCDTRTGGLKTDDGEEKVQRDKVLEQKREMERFAHYYNRYSVHDQGQRFAERHVSCVNQRVENFLQATNVKTGADADFLEIANQKLVACRRVLKYTYCYTYYMPEDTDEMVLKKNLFQNHQERLERFTEQLSELSEYALTHLDRAKVVNLITIVDKCMKNVVNFVKYGESYEYLRGEL